MWNVAAPCVDGSRGVLVVVLVVGPNLLWKPRLLLRGPLVDSEADLEVVEEASVIAVVDSGEDGEEDLEGVADLEVTEVVVDLAVTEVVVVVEGSEVAVEGSEIGEEEEEDLEIEGAAEGVASETEGEADSEVEEMTLEEEASGNRFVQVQLTVY
jgi:hypothetical protein